MSAAEIVAAEEMVAENASVDATTDKTLVPALVPVRNCAAGERQTAAAFEPQPMLFQELAAPPAANEAVPTVAGEAVRSKQPTFPAADRRHQTSSTHLRRARVLARRLRKGQLAAAGRQQMAHALCDELLAHLEELPVSGRQP